MMRWSIWILCLIPLIIAIAVLDQISAGKVVFLWPPYRVETSLQIVVFCFLISLFLGYLLTRVIVSIVALPAKFRELKKNRALKKTGQKINRKLISFILGHYKEVSNGSRESFVDEKDEFLDRVLVAAAMHKLRRYDERDSTLDMKEGSSEIVRDCLKIVKATMLMDDGFPSNALQAIQGIKNFYPNGLRLKIIASARLGDWDTVLTTIAISEKKFKVSDNEISQYKEQAYIGKLQSSYSTKIQFEKVWKNIPKIDRQIPSVLGAAAQGFNVWGDLERAEKIVENGLEKKWDEQLLKFYFELPTLNLLKKLSKAETWLERHPKDFLLLLVLGRLCRKSKLWGKAETYIENSLKIKSTKMAHMEMADLHKDTNNMEKITASYLAALKLE